MWWVLCFVLWSEFCKYRIWSPKVWSPKFKCSCKIACRRLYVKAEIDQSLMFTLRKVFFFFTNSVLLPGSNLSTCYFHPKKITSASASDTTKHLIPRPLEMWAGSQKTAGQDWLCTSTIPSTVSVKKRCLLLMLGITRRDLVIYFLLSHQIHFNYQENNS